MFLTNAFAISRGRPLYRGRELKYRTKRFLFARFGRPLYRGRELKYSPSRVMRDQVGSPSV